MKKFKINKRYKDLFEQYIHKGESTPFTIGTLTVCFMCFLLFIISTFTQINIGFSFKEIPYNPQFPIMIFIIYLLGPAYSILVFLIYIIAGLCFIPIFAFGGGLEYFQNYFFGYLLGFIPSALIAGKILHNNITIKARLYAVLFGILAIHISGFIYCIFLAIFRVIDSNLIFPIVKVVTFNKIIYDLIFAVLIILIAPYIKNVLWVCMKPIYANGKKRSPKHVLKRREVIGDDVNEHGKNNN